MSNRVEWSKYVPLTVFESRLLDYLIEHRARVALYLSNDFQKRFIQSLTDRYEQSREEGTEFYLSHRQRITLWQTITQHAHQCFPRGLFPVVQQMSAIAAACNPRPKPEENEREEQAETWGERERENSPQRFAA